MSNPSALSLAERLRMEDPLDIDDARRAARRMAEVRRAAENEYTAAVDQAAAAERDYRKAYARAFIASEGTAVEREAIAKSEAADESYKRDLAAGMVKVGAERLRGLEGERSMLKSLTDWSARMWERSAPDGPVIGGRRAA